MGKLEEAQHEIKHLEYLQKKGVSKSARRQVIGKLADKVVEHNEELGKVKDKEAERQIFNKNLERAKDFFNEKGRHRKVIFTT